MIFQEGLRLRCILAGFSVALLCLQMTGMVRAEGEAAVIHHELTVTIDPAKHFLRVRDLLRIPGSLVNDSLTLSLNAGLALQSGSGILRLDEFESNALVVDAGIDRDDSHRSTPVPVKRYRLKGAMSGSDVSLDLTYEGYIDGPLQHIGNQYARGFDETSGLIDARGIYLSGASYWIPQLKLGLLTYSLEVELPAGWKSVSQGDRLTIAGTDVRHRERWTVDTPTQEIYLVAARFSEYTRDAGVTKAMAFLRTPDQALADRYLQATSQYLDMYRTLLGPYPYSKFALVENFWETGYGMPSFTLLGEQVIRLPFILNTSYPHELLHNWWGNGVFVDYSTGNWCEGLTAYLADHLIAEQRGEGAEHRRDILQRVSDYVTAENDFPLSRFRSRHDGVTEAIGYGKTAMVLNMLREKIGDALFIRGLQAFYRDNRFKVAGFDEMRKSFETVSGSDLRPFFDQWVRSTGIPELKLDNVVANGRRLDLVLSQVQAGRRFALDIPLRVQTAAGLVSKSVAMRDDQTSVQVSFELQAPAERIDVDPQFQMYRRLSSLETPPTISKALGASKILIVVPASESIRYAGLVKAWRRDGVEVVDDSQLDRLPADRAVWLLGAKGKFAGLVSAGLAPFAAALEHGVLQIGGARYQSGDNSIVVSVRNPQNPALAVVNLIASSDASALALARKVPHYGKYSWLVFSGDDAINEAKGEWRVADTPLGIGLRANVQRIEPVFRKALVERAGN